MALKKELHDLRVGFNVIMLSVLIALIRNTIHGSVVMLEWYIVCALVIVLPCYVAWPAPVRSISWSDHKHFWIKLDRSELGRDWNGHPRVEKSKRTLTSFLLQHWKLLKDMWRDWRNSYKMWLRTEALSLGILQLLQTVYFALQPWLYFKLLNQGRKEGCMLKVFLVRYFNVWDHSWVILTRTTAIFSVIFALILFVAGCLSTVSGSFYTVYDGIHKDDLCTCGKPCMRCSVNKQNDQGAEERDAGLSAPSRETCHRGICPCDQQDVDADLEYSELTDREKERKKIFEYYIIPHFILFWELRVWQHKWFLLVAIGLVYVIQSVERTVQSNHIDIPNGDLGSASQILPFVVGLLTSLNVLKSAFIELISKFIRIKNFLAIQFDHDPERQPIWPIPRMKDERGNNVYSFPELPAKRFWRQPNFELTRRVDNETTPAVGVGGGYS